MLLRKNWFYSKQHRNINRIFLTFTKDYHKFVKPRFSLKSLFFKTKIYFYFLLQKCKIQVINSEILIHFRMILSYITLYFYAPKILYLHSLRNSIPHKKSSIETYKNKMLSVKIGIIVNRIIWLFWNQREQSRDRSEKMLNLKANQSFLLLPNNDS